MQQSAKRSSAEEPSSTLTTTYDHPIIEDIVSALFAATHPGRPAPLTRPEVPAFEPGPALETISAALREHGFHSIGPGSGVREVFARSTLDKARFGGQSPAEAARASGARAAGKREQQRPELITVDWSAHPRELRPLEDISAPWRRPAQPAAYVQGVPNGLDETPPPFDCVPTHRPSLPLPVSDEQVFLPMLDPVSGAEGWVFAFPALKDKEGPSDLSLLLLTREGSAHEVTDVPPLEAPSGSMPAPLWAWTPIQDTDHSQGTEGSPNGDPDTAPPLYARPSAPELRADAAPLGALGPLAGLAPIYTPYGAEAAGRSASLPWDVPLPTCPDGTYTVRLGDQTIASADVSDGYLSRVDPSDRARELGLWAYHVVRVAQTRLLHGEEL
jgi:hypothetical protein